MNLLKIYSLRLVTSCILALVMWRIVSAYHLLSFSGAAELSALFIFLAYWFLSQKYTWFLQVLFFIGAVSLGVKIWPLHKDPLSYNPDFLRVRQLFLLITRINLEGDDFLKTEPLPADLTMCRAKNCPNFLAEKNQAQFWIFGQTKTSDDKSDKLWYINQDLELFSGQTNNITPMPLASFPVF